MRCGKKFRLKLRRFSPVDEESNPHSPEMFCGVSDVADDVSF